MGGSKTRGGVSRSTMPVMTALALTITGTHDEAILAEHAYISASIDAGVWMPASDGLSVENFPASEQVFRWLGRYAMKEKGQAPPLDLLQSIWPEVRYIPNVGRRWAVGMLQDNERSKRIAMSLRQSLRELKEGRPDSALAIMRETVRTAGVQDREGVLLHEITEDKASDRLPSLYPAIEACGGISAGDYVLILARTNVGKSYRLMQHAASCVEQGRSVLYLSMEMRSARCANRLHQLLLGREWSNVPWSDRQQMTREWAESSGGSFRLIDDSVGAVSTESIARWSRPGDVVFVDYMGLMRNAKGQRMVEDWRVAAEISNSLRALTTELGITVFAGAQANRSAGNSHIPDDLNIAQSDAIGQDIDLGIALTRKSKDLPFTVNTVFKARSGSISEGKWFTRFNPSEGDFAEISPETAWEMSQLQEAGEGLIV